MCKTLRPIPKIFPTCLDVYLDAGAAFVSRRAPTQTAASIDPNWQVLISGHQNDSGESTQESLASHDINGSQLFAYLTLLLLSHRSLKVCVVKVDLVACTVQFNSRVLDGFAQPTCE